MPDRQELENESRESPHTEVNSDCNQIESQISFGPHLLIDIPDPKCYSEPAQLFVISAKDH